MKQGDTINLFTTKRKQVQYFDHEKVKGFKIDVRLLLDYGRNEIDLCAGEVAINTYDVDKLMHDRSKCIRESKKYAISILKQDWEETRLVGNSNFWARSVLDVNSSFSRRSFCCCMPKQVSISPKYQRSAGIYTHFKGS